MAKHYSRKTPTRRRTSRSRHAFKILLAFIGGYFLATVFDFTSLNRWVNQHLLDHPHPAEQLATHPTTLPKPKFEFYTLLTKDNTPPAITHHPLETAQTLPKDVHSTEQITSTQQIDPLSSHTTRPAQENNKPVREDSSTASTKQFSTAVELGQKKETYAVQIASFNTYQDAEHLKASLIMRGFDARITPISQHNTPWFRVVIGPFSSRNEAEKAQINIARTVHMKGMIRRLT